MKRLLSLATVLAGLATASFAATGLVITQKNKTFMPGQIDVKVGDVVKITNEDPFLHHVYIEFDRDELRLRRAAAGKDDFNPVRSRRHVRGALRDPSEDAARRSRPWLRSLSWDFAISGAAPYAPLPF